MKAEFPKMLYAGERGEVTRTVGTKAELDASLAGGWREDPLARPVNLYVETVAVAEPKVSFSFTGERGFVPVKDEVPPKEATKTKAGSKR